MSRPYKVHHAASGVLSVGQYRMRDDGYYRELVVDYLKKYGQATRRDLDELLLSKLPEVLNSAQKAHKIRNLIQAMRRDNLIYRDGPKATAEWRLAKAIAKTRSQAGD